MMTGCQLSNCMVPRNTTLTVSPLLLLLLLLQARKSMQTFLK
jgi:hypothetical protein